MPTLAEILAGPEDTTTGTDLASIVASERVPAEPIGDPVKNRQAVADGHLTGSSPATAMDGIQVIGDFEKQDPLFAESRKIGAVAVDNYLATLSPAERNAIEGSEHLDSDFPDFPGLEADQGPFTPRDAGVTPTLGGRPEGTIPTRLKELGLTREFFANIPEMVKETFKQQAGGIALSAGEQATQSISWRDRLGKLAEAAAGPVAGVDEVSDILPGPVRVAKELGDWASDAIAQGFGVDSALVEGGQQLRDEALDRIAQLQPAEKTFMQEVITSGTQSAALALPGMAVSMITRNPTALLAAFGASTYGDSYGTARDAGKSPEEAHRFALVDAGIEVGTEIGPAKIMLGASKTAIRQTLTRLFKSEMGGETLATIGQKVNSAMAGVDTMPLDQWMGELWEELKVTWATTAILTPLQGATAKLAGKAVDRLTGTDITGELEQITPEEQAAVDLRANRAGKALKATVFTAAGVAETDLDLSDEQIQKFIDNPDLSDINEADLDAIIGDEANEEALISALVDRESGVEPVGGELLPGQKVIFHGTEEIFEEFDIDKSADGTIWFTDNKSKIEKGEVAATGKGQIMERVIDENNLKLGGWEESDQFSTQELIEQGYDGLKLEDSDETTYQIFSPEKLTKTGDAIPDIEVPASGEHLDTQLSAAATVEEEQAIYDRRNEKLREIAVKDMTPAEKDQALLLNDLTHVPNRRKYAEDMREDPHDVQISVDLDGLKWANDTGGHQVGDMILGRMAKDAEFVVKGQDARNYHFSGDEFPMTARDTETAIDIITALQIRQEKSKISWKDKNNYEIELGITFGFGTDNEGNFGDADKRLIQAKEEAKALGHKSDRGEVPRSIRVRDSEGRNLSYEESVTYFEKERLKRETEAKSGKRLRDPIAEAVRNRLNPPAAIGEEVAPLATAEEEIAAFNDRDTGYPLAPKGEWFGEATYKDLGATLQAMSPDQFLASAKPLEIDEVARENIDDLKDHIESGRTLDPLSLREIDPTNVNASDGRHRAIASKELGFTEVPVIIYQEAQAAPAQLEPFAPDQIESVPLREAIDSGLISEDEGAVIDGFLESLPESLRKNFDVVFSGQEFEPTEAQLKAHDLEGAKGQVVRGALLERIKNEARDTIVMFGGSDVTTFFHEFGELSYKRLLTSDERKYVANLKTQAGSKAAPNEWFSDQLQSFMVQEKEEVFTPKLQKILSRIAGTIKKIWERIRTTHRTPALDEIFRDILSGGRGIDQRLSALHSLTPENLIFADKIGGLAVPSIAVVKEGMAVEGFGAITLIGTKDLADPEKVPVFDADAYSATFPTPEYSKPNKAGMGKIDSFFDKYTESFSESSSGTQYELDGVARRGNLEKTTRILLDSNEAKAAFIRDELGRDNLRPVLEDSPLSRMGDFSRLPAVKKFFKDNSGLDFDDPRLKELSDIVRADIEAKYPGEDRAFVRNSLLDNSFDENGILHFNRWDSMRNDQRFIGKKVVDSRANQTKLDKILKGKEERFREWVEGIVSPAFGEPTLKISGRKVPYNLDNIVRKMTGGKLSATEKTLTFGEGKARAAASKRFKNLEEMRDAAIKDVGQPKDIKEARESAKELTSDYRDAVLPYFTEKDYRGNIDTFEGLDSSMRAIAKFIKAGGGVKSMERALESEGFKDVPDDVVEMGVDAARALATAPVPYFEAKPQRAVDLSEFAGAVIPDGTSKKIKDILKKNGIKFKVYGKNRDETARTAAVESLRRDLSKKNGDVVFSVGSKEIPEDVKDRFIDEDLAEQYGQAYRSQLNAVVAQSDIDDFQAIASEASQLAVERTDQHFEDQEKLVRSDAKKRAEEVATSEPISALMDEAISQGRIKLTDQIKADYGLTITEIINKRPGLFSKDGKVILDEFAVDEGGYESERDFVEAMANAPSKVELRATLEKSFVNEDLLAIDQYRDELWQEQFFIEESQAITELLEKKKPAIRKDLKGIIRRQTGQVREEEKTVTESEALKAAFTKAAQAARAAERAGDQQGVAKEKARMKAILESAKERKQAQESRTKALDQIKKELKTTKVKKQSGKPKGKFTADIQEIFNTLRADLKLNKVDAFNKIAQNLEDYKDSIPPFSIAIENRLLSVIAAQGDGIGRLEFARIQQQGIENLLTEIKGLKGVGKSAREAQVSDKVTEITDAREKVIDLVGGIPEGIEAVGEEGVTLKGLAGIKQGIRNALIAGRTNSVVGWKDLLDIISFHDKTSKQGESAISKFGDVLEANNAEKQGNINAMSAFRGITFETYGLDSDSDMVKKFTQDAIIHDLGEFKTLNDVFIKLRMTRAEIRKRAMEIMDPTLHDTIFTPEGMGWTQEMSDAVFDFLTPQDEDFIAKQLEFYQQYYESINEVYKVIYGVNLPKNINYSPIAREGISQDAESTLGEFFNEISLRASADTAGSIKSRVATKLPLRPQSDISVIQQHVAEMEHFKAWSEKIRDLNAVFGDSDVRQAIRVNFGDKIDGEIQRFIIDMARGGTETSTRIATLDRMMGKYARSVLALKPSIFLKQLTSTVAYADSVPAAYWTKEVLKVHEIPKAVDMFFNEKTGSTLIKSRWDKGDIERDIANAMKSSEFARVRAKPSFLNAMMFNVKLGDMGAIIVGGYPVYKYHRSQGLSHEEALKRFESVTESTQQSADISQQSSWQRGGSFAKLFTMFMSSPNQYLRKEIGAIRNLAAGRMTATQFAKTMMIYHVILPMFFQLASDRFVWSGDEDEDALIPQISGEQKRAMILGSLNGFFIVGDALEAVISKALDLKVFGFENPMWSIVNDAMKAWPLLDWDDIDPEDFIIALRALAGATGAVTGLPLKQAVDFVSGFNETLSGEYETGIAQMMGWSPHQAQLAAERSEE